MDSIVEAIAKTPVPVLLIVAGILFLFLAIGGQLGAKIVTDNVKRRSAGILGVVLLAIGLGLQVYPEIGRGSGDVEDAPPTAPPEETVRRVRETVAVRPYLIKLEEIRARQDGYPGRGPWSFDITVNNQASMKVAERKFDDTAPPHRFEAQTAAVRLADGEVVEIGVVAQSHPTWTSTRSISAKIERPVAEIAAGKTLLPMKVQAEEAQNGHFELLFRVEAQH